MISDTKTAYTYTHERAAGELRTGWSSEQAWLRHTFDLTTHAGGATDHEQASSLGRTSVRVAERELHDGRIVRDRNRPLDCRRDPGLPDW